MSETKVYQVCRNRNKKNVCIYNGHININESKNQAIFQKLVSEHRANVENYGKSFYD